MRFIIRRYTREAGVRNLEREIGAICRKQARRIAEGNARRCEVTPELVEKDLGAPRFRTDTEVAERTRPAGRGRGAGLDARRRRRSLHRSRPHAGRQQRPDHDRPTGPGDAGIRAGRADLGARQRREVTASIPSCSRPSTSTSTCRRARFPRTALRPASPWRRRCSPC